MYRRTRFTIIAAASTAALGVMLLIPGDGRNSVADAAAMTEVTSFTSQETVATIDAMLGAGPAEAAPQTAALEAGVAAKPAATPKADPNLQTAALTTPQTDLEGAPLVDPDLRPDSIGPSAVNLRAGPSTATATVSVLQPGQAVQTGETDGGWVEVTLPDGTSGWVFSRYLASVAAAAPVQTETPAAELDSSTKAVVKGKSTGDLAGRTARIEASIPARAKPSSGSRSVFRTEPGERVRIIDVRGDWLRIQTADGSSGWIQAG